MFKKNYGVLLLMVIFALGACNAGKTDEIEDSRPYQGGAEMGVFYTLQEAYDKGWLMQADLENIAFYYRGSDDKSFVPSPKVPETLSEATISKIKQTQLRNLAKRVPEATLEDIWIAEYYGTYSDCVVVKVWDDCIMYDLLFIPEQIIGGVLFRNYCEREIFVWKAN